MPPSLGYFVLGLVCYFALACWWFGWLALRGRR